MATWVIPNHLMRVQIFLLLPNFLLDELVSHHTLNMKSLRSNRREEAIFPRRQIGKVTRL